MKIKEIKIYYIKSKSINNKYPIPSFFKEGFVFIKLTSCDQIEGYGEPSPYLLAPKKLLNLIQEIFNNYFKDKEIDILFTSRLKKKISNNFFATVLPAFDQAIYDISAKMKKISVSKLIAGNIKSKKLQFYASGGMLFEHQHYDLILNDVLEAKEKGYFGYKFRPKLPSKLLSHSQRMKNPPYIDIKQLEQFSKKLRLKIGNKFKIMIDLGCRCKSLNEANYLLELFEDLNFFFVEEPFIRKINHYKKINKFSSKALIALGEHVENYHQFRDWKRNNCFNFFQPDTNLLLYNEIDRIYKSLGSKKIILHNWCNKVNFLSNISFAFSLNNSILIEKNMLKNPFDELFNIEGVNIKEANVLYKDTYGFGISLNEKKLKNYEFYEKKI